MNDKVEPAGHESDDDYGWPRTGSKCLDEGLLCEAGSQRFGTDEDGYAVYLGSGCPHCSAGER